MPQDERLRGTGETLRPRRRLLAAVGAGAAGSITGCVSSVGETGGENDGDGTGDGNASTDGDDAPQVEEGGPPDPSAWEIAFQDRFDAGELDTDVWELGWGPARPTPCAFDACSTLDNVHVDADTDRLVIETTDEKPSGWGAQYTSGAITTGEAFMQAYGYFEAKAKIPAQPGSQPAFWGWADHGNPPELDFYEGYGATPENLAFHVHYDCADREDPDSFPSSGAEPAIGGRVDERFRIVGCAWRPDAVVWYVDDQELHRVDGRVAEECLSPEPIYPILNTHVNEQFGDPSTADYPYTHEFEWVRVWRHEDHEAWLEA